jgi:hypothetical protein
MNRAQTLLGPSQVCVWKIGGPFITLRLRKSLTAHLIEMNPMSS